jgi:hypothetical protein
VNVEFKVVTAHIDYAEFLCINKTTGHISLNFQLSHGIQSYKLLRDRSILDNQIFI